MRLPESIRRAWLDADYRVRLPRGGCASIRVGHPLPGPLLAFLRGDSHPWGFITAWNPRCVLQPRALNRARQRELRDALRAADFRFRAGAGIGQDGWREPSLFVAGIDFTALDALALRFGQSAVVRGTGCGIAELHALT